MVYISLSIAFTMYFFIAHTFPHFTQMTMVLIFAPDNSILQGTTRIGFLPVTLYVSSWHPSPCKIAMLWQVSTAPSGTVEPSESLQQHVHTPTNVFLLSISPRPKVSSAVFLPLFTKRPKIIFSNGWISLTFKVLERIHDGSKLIKSQFLQSEKLGIWHVVFPMESINKCILWKFKEFAWNGRPHCIWTSWTISQVLSYLHIRKIRCQCHWTNLWACFPSIVCVQMGIERRLRVQMGLSNVLRLPRKTLLRLLHWCRPPELGRNNSFPFTNPTTIHKICPSAWLHEVLLYSPENLFICRGNPWFLVCRLVGILIQMVSLCAISSSFLLPSSLSQCHYWAC